MRVLIVGGFEPSGHDSIAAALAEEGISRGHTVTNWNWGERFPIGDHPLFLLHHVAAELGTPTVAAILDRPDLPAALAQDLAGLLPIEEYDVVLSVHPWSTVIVAQCLQRNNKHVYFADVTCDFGGFPVFYPREVDVFFGSGRPRALSPQFSSKCMSVGIPARREFFATDDEKRGRLLVATAGTSGWLIERIVACIPAASRLVEPDELVVLAPNSAAATKWRSALRTSGVRADVAEVGRDVAPWLRKARWVLTKASGAAVTESLAAGCRVLAVESGVFWEDDARDYLSSRFVVIPVEVETDMREFRSLIALESTWRDACAIARSSGTVIWNAIEERRQLEPDRSAIATLREVARSLRKREPSSTLVMTEQVLDSCLREWIDLAAD